MGLKSNAFVEKDFYITRVIHAISEIQNEHFRLVLVGGTSLSKAHNITQRMSEDLYFKVYPIDENLNLFTDSTRKKLSLLRDALLKNIQEKTGLTPKENQVYNGYNNRYVKILLDYDAHYSISNMLRPQIKIELTVQQPYSSVIEQKPISSLIYHAFGDITELPTKNVHCGSLVESSSEKWAALVKHFSLVHQNKKPLDETMVRHFYDLCCIEKTEGISEAFDQLVPQIMIKELERIQEENPQLYHHLFEEMRQTSQRVIENEILEKHYEDFLNDMVFQKDPPVFRETLTLYESLNQRASYALQNNAAFQEALQNRPKKARKANTVE